MTEEEILDAYEYETGKVIVEEFSKRKIKPMDIPAILLKGHGPFTWGKDSNEAVVNAVVLEEVCKMNYYTEN